MEWRPNDDLAFGVVHRFILDSHVLAGARGADFLGGYDPASASCICKPRVRGALCGLQSRRRTLVASSLDWIRGLRRGVDHHLAILGNTTRARSGPDAPFEMRALQIKSRPARMANGGDRVCGSGCASSHGCGPRSARARRCLGFSATQPGVPGLGVGSSNDSSYPEWFLHGDADPGWTRCIRPVSLRCDSARARGATTYLGQGSLTGSADHCWLCLCSRPAPRPDGDDGGESGHSMESVARHRVCGFTPSTWTITARVFSAR